MASFILSKVTPDLVIVSMRVMIPVDLLHLNRFDGFGKYCRLKQIVHYRIDAVEEHKRCVRTCELPIVRIVVSDNNFSLTTQPNAPNTHVSP